jgi:hypothetical protein
VGTSLPVASDPAVEILARRALPGEKPSQLLPRSIGEEGDAPTAMLRDPLRADRSARPPPPTTIEPRREPRIEFSDTTRPSSTRLPLQAHFSLGASVTLTLA